MCYVLVAFCKIPELFGLLLIGPVFISKGDEVNISRNKDLALNGF